MASNPSWTREELILGLETYFLARNGGLHATDTHIVALSKLLNRLSFHPIEGRSKTFRNPVGVAMTLRKFQLFDPEYKGKGLRPEAGLKQQVWEEFVDDLDALHLAARAIRQEHAPDLAISTAEGAQPAVTASPSETTSTEPLPTSNGSSGPGRPKDKALGWIRFVRQYGPVSNNDSAFEEHTQDAARRAGVSSVYFEHPRLQDVLNAFRGQPHAQRSVVLTGTAGDGKTHLCRQVWEMLGGSADLWGSDASHLSLPLPDGTTLHLIRDLSAWVPQQGYEWPADKVELMHRFCAAIFGQESNDPFLIAVNDGQLIESWRRLPTTPEVERARDMFEELLVEDRQEEPGVRLWFYNLSRGSSAQLLDRALPAFLNHDGWSVCFDGEDGQRPAYGPQSPIRRNYELLRSPHIQKRLRDLFELCDYNGLHIPIREILALLSNAILGHRDCRDRLMLPTDVPKILQAGTVAKASLYNNLFGGNLSESRRDTSGVFNYLDRFRVGHETTNRIDTLLIFGETDESLKPYFDRFLGADEFYGADTAYREAQKRYVEGAEEDESKNTAFLSMLVAQRRALFFKIRPEEADELRLWELTVFRSGGEYLTRIVRVLQSGTSTSPSTSGRVDRTILGRLVRGLNRVFVGMLVTSERELHLGTSLHSTHARVSRILEESISVTRKSGGERVEIVWRDERPMLEVALEHDIVRHFPLNLVRYEFLLRVAEGALPGSFSKECYEDVLSFKSQVLSALAERRAKYESNEHPQTLIFNRLALDDSGSPYPDPIEVTAEVSRSQAPQVLEGEPLPL